jgi:hypothetical protein
MEVYRDVALQSILQYQNLEVLHYAWSTAHYDYSWPSWIPRWDIPNTHCVPLLYPFIYNAGRNYRPMYDVQLKTDSLIAQGFVIGHIAQKDWVLRFPTEDDQSASKFLVKEKLLTMMTLVTRDCWQPDRANENTASRTEAHVPTQFADFSAFVLRHLGDQIENRYISLYCIWCERCNEPFSRYQGGASFLPTTFYHCHICRDGDFDLCVDCYNKNPRCNDLNHTISVVSTTNIWLPHSPNIIGTLESYASGGQSDRFNFHAVYCCKRVAFFRTSTGHQGSGSEMLQRDDVVAVLLGSRVPFILRKFGSAYRLVSDCYVEGFMDGEAIDMWHSGALDLTGFQIT